MISPHPHPKLVPLLEKYSLTWENFSLKGRLPAHLSSVRAARSAIVSELHGAGVPWKVMCEITGFSLGSIQRLTTETSNEASRQNLRENARRVGTSLKGKSKPWLSTRMVSLWAAGTFDFHRGRIRSTSEIEKQKEAHQRPEYKQKRAKASKEMWANVSYRQKLLDYHRSPEERSRRSLEQILRLQDDPIKWSRGRGSHVGGLLKCGTPRVWVRSSYEKAALAKVEGDDLVKSYEVEPRLSTGDGHWILPDLLVTYTFGKVLVEVKASWVLKLPPNHKVSLRLSAARSLAIEAGWGYAVWTEKDLAPWMT